MLCPCTERVQTDMPKRKSHAEKECLWHSHIKSGQVWLDSVQHPQHVVWYCWESLGPSASTSVQGVELHLAHGADEMNSILPSTPSQGLWLRYCYYHLCQNTHVYVCQFYTGALHGGATGECTPVSLLGIPPQRGELRVRSQQCPPCASVLFWSFTTRM